MPKFAPMPRLCESCARSVRSLVVQSGETVYKHCPEHRVLAIARVQNRVIVSWEIFGPLTEGELDAMAARIQTALASHLVAQMQPPGSPTN